MTYFTDSILLFVRAHCGCLMGFVILSLLAGYVEKEQAISMLSSASNAERIYDKSPVLTPLEQVT